MCSLLALAAWFPGSTAVATESERAAFAQAVLVDDDARIETIKQLSASTDAQVARGLAAWRAGELFVWNGESSAAQVFVLDAETDADGRARAMRLDTGEPLQDADGAAVTLRASELTPVDTHSKLRRALKQALDLMALNATDPLARRDAASKLGFEQNADFLPVFEARLAVETHAGVRRALREAAAITRLASTDPATQRAGILVLGELKTLGASDLLKRVRDRTLAAGARPDPETAAAANAALKRIEDHRTAVNLIGTGFRGLSLASVLLIAALGLAITFGLMGVINMAHGEIIMIGAYTAYFTQTLFVRWFGPSGPGFDCYILAAIVAAFAVAGLVGLVLERSLIRFLYKRPLESLLATWGISLVLQQLCRTCFGAANVQVYSPSWLSGSAAWNDVLFAYNRMFVVGVAVLVVAGTYLLLNRTSAGLQIRAVMQNRNMAASLGVSTSHVYARTFALGSGLAGVAGACLSQIGNVGPNLGQSHIVDCFMIVVLGGIGNLIGTVCASLGVGVVDQVLQPFLGAVMGKITVLAGIILFLQWRPAGLFVTRSRALED
ncbi:MAG: urea ABC transporter permease subunit UrtB [Verrucomicrobia bacterium]|nr:urea ABC transporter permease subunit UrtB [Verrucomicrobiota bacterium]